MMPKLCQSDHFKRLLQQIMLNGKLNTFLIDNMTVISQIQTSNLLDNDT